MIQAVRNIAAKEEITVKYEESGYYGNRCRCETCTKVDTRDLSVLKLKWAMAKEGAGSMKMVKCSHD